MTPTVLRIVMALGMVLLLLPGTARGASQPALVPMYFTSVTGENTSEGRVVLLRWYALEELITLESAVIFRSSASSPRERISVVKKLRDPNAIASVFYSAGRERVREDLVATLERIYGPPIDATNVGDLLVDVLEGTGTSEAGVFRRMFMIQGNYGVAIVEGLGYLDTVPNAGPWTYELWQGDAAGNPVQALGRIVVDATAATVLPAPQNLREVQLLARGSTTEASEANNQRIFLNWDIPAALDDLSGAMFGFDVYRLGRALAPGETFADVQAELEKRNESPIVPMSSQIGGEDPNQAYMFADWGDGMEGGDLLPIGATYTYWAVPRDLLGQAGQETNPVTVVVRDTSAPNPPKGLAVSQWNDNNGAPRLVASWNKQLEDTVSYNVYRYLDYTHAQSKGPFADIDGFTEGLIASGIAQPGDAETKLYFADTTISSTTGKVFWYCVSAMDAFGNESALSPPVFGVIDDLLGPAIAGDLRICYDVVSSSANGRQTTTKQEDRRRYWVARFISENTSGFATMEIDRYDFGGRGATHLPAVQSSRSGEFTYEDEMPNVTDVTQAPRYCVRLVDEAGRTTNEVCFDPPSTWTPDLIAVFYISGQRSVKRECRGNEAGPRPVDPRPGNPVTFEIPCTGESTEVRLYRSLDCENYELVEEVPCGGGGVTLTDTFIPAGLAEVCYMLQGFDENGNPGPKFFLLPTFVFNNQLAKPTLKSVTPTGTESDPTAQLKWIGPKAGVSHYNVYFTKVGEPDPAKPLQYSAETTSYNPATAEFSAPAVRADKDLTPIDPYAAYEVRVEAVSFGGAKKASDVLPFHWGVESLQEGKFYWPPRPLPPVVAHPLDTAVWDTEQQEVLIPLATEGVVKGRNDPRIGLIPDVPFTIWRRRVDKENQPWLNVFPLFESILVTPGVVGGPQWDLKDPFFGYWSPNTNISYLAVRDDAGLVFGAKYEYMYVALDPETYEIDRLVGPITANIPTP